MTEITRSEKGPNGSHGTIVSQPSNEEIFGMHYQPSAMLAPGDDLYDVRRDPPSDPYAP